MNGPDPTERGAGRAGPDDALRLARALDRRAEHRAAAAEALLAADLGRRAGRDDAIVAAALIRLGVPDPATAATIETICRMALARAADGAAAERARIHGRLSVALHHREQLGEAAEHAARAATLATGLDDPLATAAARHAEQMAALGAGDPATIVAIGAALLDCAWASGSEEVELLARTARLEGLFRLADSAGIARELDSLDVLAARTGSPEIRWNAILGRAGFDHARGRLAEAEAGARLARSALPASQRSQTEPLFVAQVMLIATDRGTMPAEVELARRAAIGAPVIAVAMTGRFDLETGDPGRARASYESALPRLADLPMDRRGLPALLAVADLAATFGDRTVAEDLRRRLIPYDGRMIASPLGAVGPVAWFLARAESLLGDHDAAVDHAAGAIELCARGDFGPWLARSRFGHADALVRRDRPGDRAAARGSAELALTTAREIGMAGLTARAEAFLERLTAVERLSPREREVAQLVASGSSNRAIAEALTLSERTVETHVQNILVKLDARSRTQIATWALRVGLAVPGSGT